MLSFFTANSFSSGKLFACTNNLTDQEGVLHNLFILLVINPEHLCKGVRHKEYDQVEFNIYHCYECDHETMIPNAESSTGYKCVFCGNEDSDDIEVECDCCGIKALSEEMDIWPMDDGTSEYRCYYCSGRYHADKDD